MQCCNVYAMFDNLQIFQPACPTQNVVAECDLELPVVFLNMAMAESTESCVSSLVGMNEIKAAVHQLIRLSLLSFQHCHLCLWYWFKDPQLMSAEAARFALLPFFLQM